MERARKRINRGIRVYYYKSSAKMITHADLQDGHKALYADDGAFCTKWQHNYLNEIKAQCLLTPIILVFFIRKHSVLSNQS
jgi:hypothetical protein